MTNLQEQGILLSSIFICTLWKPRDQIKSFLRAAYGVSLNGRSVHYSFNQNDNIWRRCRAFSHKGHSLLILGPSLLSVCRFWVKGDEIWNCHITIWQERIPLENTPSRQRCLSTQRRNRLTIESALSCWLHSNEIKTRYCYFQNHGNISFFLIL